MLDIERIFELREELRIQKGWKNYNIDRLKDHTLNLIGELGEVTDIYKKKSIESIMTDPKIRQHFLEEMVDVSLYYFNMLLCIEATPEEFEEAFMKKHNELLGRDFKAKWEKD